MVRLYVCLWCFLKHLCTCNFNTDIIIFITTLQAEMYPIIICNFFLFFVKSFSSPGTTQGEFLVPSQIGKKQTNKHLTKRQRNISYQLPSPGNQVQHFLFLFSDLLKKFLSWLLLWDTSEIRQYNFSSRSPTIYILTLESNTNLTNLCFLLV